MLKLKHALISVFRSLQKAYSWLKPFFYDYGILLIILLAEHILIRIYEFLCLNHAFQFKLSNIRFELLGVYYDFLFIAFLSVVFIIPFIILHKISAKISRIVFYILNSVYILITLLLIEYLKYTFIPLDHAVFAYPLNELIYIAKESVDITYWHFIRIIGITSLGVILTVIFIQKLKTKLLPFISLAFILSGIFLTKNLNPPRRNFTSETAFNLTINKFSFFSKSCVNYLAGDQSITSLEFQNIASEFHSYHQDSTYDNLNYPLEHTPNTTDNLSRYFNLNEEPPNLVFIIMESLSSAFCGSNAYMGNFTPFLDSLITQSLYWENFLSTSERTFNAIPSIFGSLPYGEKGFMVLVGDDFAVNHTTLIKWLNKNDYYTNFFYGGWTGFDNMEKFMKYQNIDFILEEFGDNYSKIDKDKNGVTWGYPDDQMFQRSIEVLDSANKNPRLDIYLTLSLHHPFKPPNRTYYHQKFLHILKTLNLSEEQKQEAINHSDVFSTILYTDEAFEFLITEYKKRKGYQNTIFIITGDHRMSTQNKRSVLDIYHVPLIIFSPMLKTPEKFSSISSHLNIAPTFYPFLANNFGFEMPNKVHWLGNQIDFSKQFNSKQILPLMRTNREITDYLSGKYVISNDQLFEITEKLELKPFNNKILLDSLKKARANFFQLNKYITENNLILSDE